MLSLALNLCTLFPNLHVTFFAPATSTSLTSPASGSALSPSPSLSNGKEKAATPGVVEREIALFQPSEDVLRRFRVVPLGHRSPSSSSTPTPPPVSAPTTETKSAGDIQLEEVSRRRKAWSGHVNAFLEDLPGALRALRKTRECEAGSVCGVNGKVIEGERGFARRPTLFVADVRISTLWLIELTEMLTAFSVYRLTFAIAQLLLGALPDTVARTAADPSSDFRSLPILSFSPTPAAWNVRYVHRHIICAEQESNTSDVDEDGCRPEAGNDTKLCARIRRTRGCRMMSCSRRCVLYVFVGPAAPKIRGSGCEAGADCGSVCLNFV